MNKNNIEFTKKNVDDVNPFEMFLNVFLSLPCYKLTYSDLDEAISLIESKLNIEKPLIKESLALKVKKFFLNDIISL